MREVVQRVVVLEHFRKVAARADAMLRLLQLERCVRLEAGHKLLEREHAVCAQAAGDARARAGAPRGRGRDVREIREWGS